MAELHQWTMSDIMNSDIQASEVAFCYRNMIPLPEAIIPPMNSDRPTDLGWDAFPNHLQMALNSMMGYPISKQCNWEYQIKKNKHGRNVIVIQSSLGYCVVELGHCHKDESHWDKTSLVVSLQPSNDPLKRGEFRTKCLLHDHSKLYTCVETAELIRAHVGYIKSTHVPRSCSRYSIRDIFEEMTAIEQAVFECTATDTDISALVLKLMKQFRPDRPFVCHDYSRKQSRFHEFNGTYWTEHQDEIAVARFISSSVSKALNEFAIKYSDYLSSDSMDNQALKSTFRIIDSRVNHYNSQMNVLMFFAREIDDKDFYDKLNRNPMLLCFEDVVLDLSTMTTRAGEPEDFISISTGYPFPTDAAPKDRETIEDFFAKVFPDEDTRDYVVRALAYCLCGNRDPNLSFMLTGHGSNGKSILEALMCAALGRYAIRIDPARFVTGKSDPRTGDPFMMSWQGARIAFTSNPDDTQHLSVSSYKRLMGGEVHHARPLYSNKLYKIILGHRLFMLVNELLPLSSGTDGGAQSRIRVVPMQSRFTSEQTEVNPRDNIYASDSTLKSRAIELRGALMIYLLNHFDPQWNGLSSTLVHEASSVYLGDNNSVALYLHRSLVKSDISSIVSVRKELYKRYKCGSSKCTDFGSFANNVRKWVQDQRHGSYVERHQIVTTTGMRTCRRNVLIGWTILPFDGEHGSN
jgi:phage/plasmid-associated DNA primase